MKLTRINYASGDDIMIRINRDGIWLQFRKYGLALLYGDLC